MTQQSDLKALVRLRMEKTGERYTAARRHVLMARERVSQPGIAEPSAAPAAATVEAIVLKIDKRSGRVRLLPDGDEVTFRSRDLWRCVPGQVLTISVERRWTYRGFVHASGDVLDARIDIAALALDPLPIEGGRPLDPRQAYEPETHPKLRGIWKRIAAGPRPSFELEYQRLGEDIDDDPILEAVDLKEAGLVDEARDLLMELLLVDLQLVDAHVAPRQSRAGSRSEPRLAALRGRCAPGRAEHPGHGTAGDAHVGVHRKPPVPAMHSRLRSGLMAAGSLARGGGGVRADAVAQPQRQPGRAVLLAGRACGEIVEGGRGGGSRPPDLSRRLLPRTGADREPSNRVSGSLGRSDATLIVLR